MALEGDDLWRRAGMYERRRSFFLGNLDPSPYGPVLQGLLNWDWRCSGWSRPAQGDAAIPSRTRRIQMPTTTAPMARAVRVLRTFNPRRATSTAGLEASPAGAPARASSHCLRTLTGGPCAGSPPGIGADIFSPSVIPQTVPLLQEVALRLNACTWEPPRREPPSFVRAGSALVKRLSHLRRSAKPRRRWCSVRHLWRRRNRTSPEYAAAVWRESSVLSGRLCRV